MRGRWKQGFGSVSFISLSGAEAVRSSRDVFALVAVQQSLKGRSNLSPCRSLTGPLRVVSGVGDFFTRLTRLTQSDAADAADAATDAADAATVTADEADAVDQVGPGEAS